MPVLTEKAVERTGVVEDCQILVTIFGTWTIGKIWVPSSCTARADPVGNAVGGEWVMVPAQITTIWCGTGKFVPFVHPHATIASLPLRQAAFIWTEVASKPLF